MAKAKQKKELESDKKDLKLVKMKLDGKSADVHPLEVDNYKASGWVKAK